MSRAVSERLYAQEQLVEEKTRELQQQRRDHAAAIASYDQRLQKARMQVRWFGSNQ
jgi:hypothetical protein